MEIRSPHRAGHRSSQIGGLKGMKAPAGRRLSRARRGVRAAGAEDGASGFNIGFVSAEPLPGEDRALGSEKRLVSRLVSPWRK